MTDLAFYTNFQVHGNKLKVRGYSADHDKPVFETHKIDSSIYTDKASDRLELSQFKTLKENPLYKISFENVKDRRQFLKDQGDAVYYGATNLDYAGITELFPDGIKLDKSMQAKIRIAIIDIEVESEQVFGKPNNPIERVNAVTVLYHGTAYTMALMQHTPDENTQFKFCESEIQIFEELKKLFQLIQPDIISGWYSDWFDMPYLIERAKILYGDDSWGKAISPWGYVSESENYENGQGKVYEIAGIVLLDYKRLYEQYGKKQPDMKLKTVAKAELGETKLEFEGSLRDFYLADPHRFILYNIQDCRLIEKMDKKLHFFTIAFMLSYRTLTKYTDIFSQVRMWEMSIYRELKFRHGTLPHIKHFGKKKDSEQYEGAFVFDPIPALYNWCMTFDVTGLYPILMMMLNISPETIMEMVECDVDTFVDRGEKFNNVRKYAIDNDCILAVNGALFTKKRRGFLPLMLEDMTGERARYKKLMLDTELQIEKLKADTSTDHSVEIAELTDVHILYDASQFALKTGAASCYGACGSKDFMFFNVNIAEAVTISGQYSIQNVSTILQNYLRSISKNEKDRFWIYSDTDSVYLSLESLVKKFLPDSTTDEIEQFIDKIGNTKLKEKIEETFNQQRLDHNVSTEHRISMKREYICDRILVAKSKMYAMHVLNKEGGVHLTTPQIIIKGLTSVRSDTPNVCRSKIKECLNLIFTSDEKTMIDFITKFRDEFEQLPLEEIGAPIGINKLSKYYDEEQGVMQKKITQQLRATVVYNKLIKETGTELKYDKIVEGDRVKILFLKMPNRAKSNVIAISDKLPPEFRLHNKIDLERQFEKTFLKPVTRLLDIVGWSNEHVETLLD